MLTYSCPTMIYAMSCLLRLFCLATVTGGVLFAVPRLYDVIWRFTCVQVVDPASLSTTTLRGLLDDWSVDYKGVTEKSELVQMVKQIGPLDEEHVKSVHAADTKTLTPDTSFTSGKDFFMDMTSGNRSGVWLLLIVTRLDENPVYESRALNTWTVVRKHVTRLDVRTGTLDCERQPRYCENRGWSPARVLLVLPQNIEDDYNRGRPGSGRAKSASVIIHVYDGPLNKRSVITWFAEELQEKIVNIVSLTRLHSKWLTSGARSGPAFRAVFFTDQTTTPTFLSMASIQYMDMVQFGVIRETSGHLLKWMKENNVGDTFPQMMILSRDGTNYVYGKAVGEYLSLVSLQNFFDMFRTFAVYELFQCVFVGFVICWVATKMDESDRLANSMFDFSIAFIMWWGMLVPGKSLVSMALGTPFPFTASLLTTIPVGSSLLYDLLFYTQHPYLLVICLVLARFFLDRLLLRADFADMTPFLTRLPQVRDITSVLPATSRPGAECLQPAVQHESDNDMENSETSSVYETQSIPETDSDNRFENSVTDNENLNSENSDSWTTVSDTDSDSSEPAPSRSLHRNDESFSLRAGLREDSQNNTVQADHAAEHHPTEGDTTHDSARASTGAERVARSAESVAEPTPSSAPEDAREDPFQIFWRRMMLERRVPSRLVEIDGRHISVPCYQRFYGPNVDYIDHLPTWEYSAGVEAMEATNASCSTRSEDCVDVCVVVTVSKQSGIPARPVQTGFPAGYVRPVDCVICQGEFTNGEKLCRLPCKHAFHYTCIKRWLTEGNHSCPVCRNPPYQQ